MATTTVTFTEHGNAPVPNNASVPVSSGDTVNFVPDESRPAFLYFSPDLIAILTPEPSDGAMAFSGTVSFQFTSSDAGSYVVMASNSANENPNFGDAPSNHVRITTMMHSMSGGFPFPPGGPGDTGS